MSNSTDSRVLRGGSWDSDAEGCRSTARDEGVPSYRHDPLGFRLVYREKYGSFRVVRGGSWSSVADICRSAARSWLEPWGRDDYLGFRLIYREKSCLSTKYYEAGPGTTLRRTPARPTAPGYSPLAGTPSSASVSSTGGD
jgi:hypothetical protein